MPTCPYCRSHIKYQRNLTNHQSKDAHCKAIRAAARKKLFKQLQETPSTHSSILPTLGDTPGSSDAMSLDFDMSHNDEVADHDADACQPLTQAHEDSDHDETLWDEPFPAVQQAGAAFDNTKTIFETYRDDQILQGDEILGPFFSDAEWDLAKWLIKNVGHNQAEVFLKLPIVSQCPIVIV